MDESDASSYAPIVVGRLGNINLDSVFRDQQKYNQISVQVNNFTEFTDLYMLL